ncbi:MAG: hypothetical protein JO301_09475 [Chitinophagaceae bacterium]|nr:hypothetical protein [Chitinophagaceae bacterium]
MKEQTYSTHTRYVFGYHVFTYLAVFALMIGSYFNLSRSAPENLYSASLICLISVILLLVVWYLRAFALKAQDRAIRAEENFRYYLLTGKPLPAGLRMGQIIALRFAQDEELPELVERALSENLRSRQIKEAIRNWRPDYHRV